MSETPQQPSKMILPTLMANLNYVVGEYLQRRNAGYIYESWTALKQIYIILPPPIFKDKTIQKQHREIERFLNRNNGNGRNNFLDQRNDLKRSLAFLNAHIDDLFRSCYNLLYSQGYLEKHGVAPKYDTQSNLAWDSK